MITIILNGQTYTAQPQQTVLQVMRRHNVSVEQPCGGYGKCGKCKIQCVDGQLSPLTDEEQNLLTASDIRHGYRLACMARIIETCTLTQPENSSGHERILTEGERPTVSLSPGLSKTVVALNTLTIEQLSLLHESNTYLQTLPDIPPEQSTDQDKLATIVTYEDNLIGVEAGNTALQLYGIALDIGTTTVVCTLVNLNNGNMLATASCINPQKNEGLDVLSRITFAKTQTGLQTLHKLITDCIQYLVNKLCIKAKIDHHHIYEIVVAANTTMLHLLLNIDPSSLGRYPYTPSFTASQTVKASQLNIAISPFGRVYTLPAVSGFIGGDIVAGAAIANLEHQNNVLFIDIGTNGEMILAQHGQLTACSCAAGPALEGMNISMGMRASPGAIEHVSLQPDGQFKISTIGNLPAQGICGSGLISAIAAFVNAGTIAPTGRIQADKAHVTQDGRKRFLCLCTHPQCITISQEDIRQVQLAKGAILAGILTLLDAHSMTPAALNEVIIAGQFGHHLTADSLTGAGIVPNILHDRIHYIGNAAQNGALNCLLSGKERIRANTLARQIVYQELSVQADFNQRFINCLSFC